MYSEGRSLLIWPDETVVSSLQRHRGKFKRGLDIGCGAGRHTLLMGQEGIEALGVDSSTAGVEFGQKRAKAMNLSNVAFRQSPAQAFDAPAQTYDIVIAWGLIHYMTDEDQIAFRTNVLRFLKPGGLFLLTMRSVADTRVQHGKKISGHRYLVDYFDKGTNTPKQTEMCLWDEKGVREFLKDFKNVSLGHRALAAIGDLENVSSHWLIEATR